MAKIIGVSAKAQSGKGEFAKIASELYGAQVVSFAAGVKEEVAEFLDMVDVAYEPRHLYGSQENKEEHLCVNLRAIPAEATFFWDFAQMYGSYVGSKCYFTPRALMQFWGTEYRRSQDEQYWVKKALAKCSGTGPIIYVIDDCRFKNEAQALREIGAVLVRVNRPGGPLPSNPDHPSETDLDDWTGWDIVIENVGSLEAYHSMVEYALDAVCAIDDLGVEHVQQGPL